MTAVADLTTRPKHFAMATLYLTRAARLARQDSDGAEKRSRIADIVSRVLDGRRADQARTHRVEADEEGQVRRDCLTILRRKFPDWEKTPSSGC